MLWQLIPLNEINIESIEYLDEVSLGGIGEVRPVEAISHVEFVDAFSDVGIFSGGVIHTLLDINRIKIQEFSLVH